MFLIRRIDSSNLTRRWGPHPGKTRAIPPMWEHCWASVADACPTLIPHRGNGSFTKRIVLFDTLSIGKCGFLNMCFRYHRKWIQWQDHNITVALASALMAPITSKKTLELLKMLSVDNNIKASRLKMVTSESGRVRFFEQRSDQENGWVCFPEERSGQPHMIECGSMRSENVRVITSGNCVKLDVNVVFVNALGHGKTPELLLIVSLISYSRPNGFIWLSTCHTQQMPLRLNIPETSCFCMTV